jgi:predicted lipid-binding transport protein (Tim44 family)
MTKETDVDDLLGGEPAVAKPAAKKAPAKKAAKKAPAKKAVAKPAAKKAPAKKAAVKEATVKEPVTFAEGEREALIKRIKQVVKKPWNSKDLAEKLEITTRKLRQVLYSANRQGIVDLELGSSRVAGMTVTPAAA